MAATRRHKWFCIVMAVGLLLYLTISLSKHLHFGSTGYDLVIFDQAVRHYSQFMAPASSFRGFDNLLGDHFHPILALLAPLYWVFDSPISLLIAQAVLIISAAVPIYLYALQKLDKRSAIFVVIAFILNAALLRAIYFDFHEIAFAIPLIAWLIYFAEHGQWKRMYGALALLLLVKETFGIFAVFFGLYLIAKRQYWRGSVIIAVGVVSFLLITKIIIPHFAGGGSFNYWTYSQLGPDLPSAIASIFTNPLFAVSLLFIPIIKVVTLIKTFGIFMGLTFFSPIIILAIPLILERFLSSNSNYWQFHFHYGATLTPILLFAFIDSVDRIPKLNALKKLKLNRFKAWVSGAAAVIAGALFVVSPMNFIFKPSNWTLSQSERAGYAMISSLRQDDIVCTTNHIAPHVGQYELYSIDTTMTGNGRCNLLITADEYDVVDRAAVDLVIERGKYQLVNEDRGWRLYRR